ncbi:hypothetical protein LBMAG47_17620 [Planctomycetia bacterium]|nr:hypothetical protein LBMAG47_17620 [Planctomycetia bacterium]
MAYALFFVFVIVACLMWTAACTACVARLRPGWLRRIIVIAAIAVPCLTVAPWLLLTAGLAQAGLYHNWFAPTLAAALAVVVGGVWIVRTGLAPQAAPTAGGWPLVRLVTLLVLAKVAAAATLLFIDESVRADVRMARIEAAQIMQSVAPPQPLLDDDAAPLYLQALASLDADDVLTGPESPLSSAPPRVDVTSAAVTDLLARHAGTLDVLRRAADRPGCRFVRDWSRPSLAMILADVAWVRQAARLLAIDARRRAADGDMAAALADVVRLRRMAMHVAAEPFLISGLIGAAVDTWNLETLVAILPAVTAADAAAAAEPAIDDLVRGPVSFQRHIIGEEAFGLAGIASLADGSLADDENLQVGPPPRGALILFRCFSLPNDLAMYKSCMRQSRALLERADMPRSTFRELDREATTIGNEFMASRKSVLVGMIGPAIHAIPIHAILKAQTSNRARHRAAEMILAATRARLKTGSLPESADSLVPEFLIALPADPYRDQGPLTVRIDAAGWLVYSVGPDGEDDGGPPQDSEHVDGNDDVGLRLSR